MPESKTCLICGMVAGSDAFTCVACGEASWSAPSAIAAEEKPAADGEVSAPHADEKPARGKRR